MSDLKEKYNFRFILHFVVQKDNYHEMEDIIQLGKDYNADRVWLNKIEDWNVLSNFEEQKNLFTTKEYKNCIDKIKQIVLNQKTRFVECPTLIN